MSSSFLPLIEYRNIVGYVELKTSDDLLSEIGALSRERVYEQASDEEKTYAQAFPKFNFSVSNEKVETYYYFKYTENCKWYCWSSNKPIRKTFDNIFVRVLSLS